MIIDSQVSWYPPEIIAEAKKRNSPPHVIHNGTESYVSTKGVTPIPFTSEHVDLELQIQTQARYGIDAAIVGPSYIGDVTRLDLKLAVEWARIYNKSYGEAQRAYPGKFFGLATLPLQDTTAALEVLDEAIMEQDLVGVFIHSNIAGQSIAKEEMRPVYKRIEELGVPIFIHPTRSIVHYPDQLDWFVEVTFGWMFDTTVAAMSLILSGMLDEFPSLQIVHPHFGGILPYLRGRIRDGMEDPWAPDLKRPVDDYLKTNFYTDTAVRAPENNQLVFDTYGPDRVLFSSDYPWQKIPDYLAFAREHIQEQHLAAVLGDNAARLFKLPTIKRDTVSTETIATIS